MSNSSSQHARIVVLTGAGLSAESGLQTFRDPNGIWASVDYRDVATAEGFARNPDLVHAFYNQRRAQLHDVAPNAAHLALARLQAEHPGEVLIVTQNIDDLHEAAGRGPLIHMHGELRKGWCRACDARAPWLDDMGRGSRCTSCGEVGHMRPDVVWFGEIPYLMETIAGALAACDLFVSIGTSGNVYPAAGFVALAADAGAHTVELNLEPSEGASLFAEAVHGPATLVVPAYVERLLAR